jgi:hypothetical protein
LSWEVEAIGTKTMALTTMSLSSFHRRRRYESELFGDHIGYKKNNLLWLEDIPLWSFLLTVTVWCLRFCPHALLRKLRLQEMAKEQQVLFWRK